MSRNGSVYENAVTFNHLKGVLMINSNNLLMIYTLMINEETFASELLEHLKEEMMLPAGLKPHTGVLSVIQI